MKKRWAAGILCILLLFQLSSPVQAAGKVYFVAAEESVRPLSDASMPFWHGGYLYVAASVFTNLGASVINNTAKGLMVLEKERRALLFDQTREPCRTAAAHPTRRERCNPAVRYSCRRPW